MESLLPMIVRKTEAEAIYMRERQRVNRERFRAYYADFHDACVQRDYRRAFEVVQDATMITNDMLRLVRRRGEIGMRRHALASGHGFADPPVSSPMRVDRDADEHGMRSYPPAAFPQRERGSGLRDAEAFEGGHGIEKSHPFPRREGVGG